MDYAPDMFTLVYAFCHGLAWGHAGAVLDAIDVVRPTDTTFMHLETTVGYLREQENQRFEWICHEAVTQPDAIITPRYTENTDGVMLVTIGDILQARDTELSMYRSIDGCHWSAPAGLDNQQVSFVQFSPCLLYTSPSPRDRQKSRMPSSA